VLLDALADPTWTAMRAAMAYTKVNGVRHLSESLQVFIGRGGDCKMVMGIHPQGSSLEAIEELFLILEDGGGEIYGLRNPVGSPAPSFHPKVWYFASAAPTRALLIVTSGNLTEGGIYANYEVGTASYLDARRDEDGAVMADVETMFADWCDPSQPHVVRLDVETMQRLHDSGELPTEDAIRRGGRLARSSMARVSAVKSVALFSGLFGGSPTAPPPAVPDPPPTLGTRPVKRVVSVTARAEPSAGGKAGAADQDTIGSPTFVPIHRVLRIRVHPDGNSELVLPKDVFDSDPAFFGAPFAGITDLGPGTEHGQPQASPFPLVAVTVFSATGEVRAALDPHKLKMWTYSVGPAADDDLRLTLPAELFRHVQRGSVLVMEHDPDVPDLDYTLDLYPPGHPDHDGLLALCSEAAPDAVSRYGWE
jgi:hypothetical protein